MGKITYHKNKHGYLVMSGSTLIKRVPDEATAIKMVDRLNRNRRIQLAEKNKTARRTLAWRKR